MFTDRRLMAVHYSLFLWQIITLPILYSLSKSALLEWLTKVLNVYAQNKLL